MRLKRPRRPLCSSAWLQGCHHEPHLGAQLCGRHNRVLDERKSHNSFHKIFLILHMRKVRIKLYKMWLAQSRTVISRSGQLHHHVPCQLLGILLSHNQIFYSPLVFNIIVAVVFLLNLVSSSADSLAVGSWVSYTEEPTTLNKNMAINRLPNPTLSPAPKVNDLVGFYSHFLLGWSVSPQLFLSKSDVPECKEYRI